MADTLLVTDLSGRNSWVTQTEAETYLQLRLGAVDVWNEGVDETEKQAALATAYRNLKNCGIFTIDESSVTQAMKDAQCEQALFLLQHGRDIDSRLGLQRQGVKQSGLAQETYELIGTGRIPICTNALALLNDSKQSSGFAIGELERDEDEDIT